MDVISIYSNVIFECIKGKDNNLADKLSRLNKKGPNYMFIFNMIPIGPAPIDKGKGVAPASDTCSDSIWQYSF